MHFLYVLRHFGIDCLLLLSVLATNLQTFKTSVRNVDSSYTYLGKM